MDSSPLFRAIKTHKLIKYEHIFVKRQPHRRENSSQASETRGTMTFPFGVWWEAEEVRKCWKWDQEDRDVSDYSDLTTKYDFRNF